MWHDPIVEEIRKLREAHAARFGYDLQAIYQDLKAQEKMSGRIYVRFPPKPVDPADIVALPPDAKESA